MPSRSLFARTFPPCSLRIPYIIITARHLKDTSPPLPEHCRKLLMPTPVRSEVRSLRHSRNSDVVFQEDAKNFGLFIQKRSNSERKGTIFVRNFNNFCRNINPNMHEEAYLCMKRQLFYRFWQCNRNNFVILQTQTSE